MSTEPEESGDRSGQADGKRRRGSEDGNERPDRDSGDARAPESPSRPPFVPTAPTTGQHRQRPTDVRDRPSQQRTNGLRTPEAFDARGGLVVGAAAYVVGYVVVALLTAIETDGSFAIAPEASEELSIASYQTVGWLFYNAHFVDVGFELFGLGLWVNLLNGDLSGSLVELSRAMSEEFGGSESELAAFDGVLSTVPFPVWVAVPVVVLVVAGYLLARRAEVDDPTEAAMAGAAVVVGYFALTMVGAYVFTASVGSSMFQIDVSPQYTQAAGLMGFVYPVVFGGVGGAVAAKVRERSTPEPQAE